LEYKLFHLAQISFCTKYNFLDAFVQSMIDIYITHSCKKRKLLLRQYQLSNVNCTNFFYQMLICLTNIIVFSKG